MSRRMATTAMGLALIAGLGLVFHSLPPLYNVPREAAPRPTAVAPTLGARTEPAQHARQARKQELRTRFDEAVTMLHAHRYEYAVAALHRVLELSPRMPEAYVNMGYALLGMKTYGAAEDFFLGAVDLNPRQANAYYGLAEVHEAQGDLRRAMGAMRTYLHLARPDAPHRSRAMAALWEWQAQLAQPQAGLKP